MGPRDFKKRFACAYSVFIMVTAGFVGLMVFEEVVEEVEVEAATLTVGQAGSGAQYNTIQAAIDNASSGDTIRVWAGTYYENVVVNKTISLIGNGTGNTTIDGGGVGDVVYVTEDWVNISSIRAINSGDQGLPYCDSGFHLHHVNNVTISYCNNSNNVYGIYQVYSNRSYIFNNDCDNNTQYGIRLYYSDGNRIENNNCNSNGGWGIGLADSNSNTISIFSCKFNNIYHGIIVSSSDYNSIINNTCNQNDDDGIFLISSNLNLIDTNTCISNGEYGISLHHASWNIIQNSTCNSNSDGVYLDSSDWNVLGNNNFNSNEISGITLDDSDRNNIANNTCNFNDQRGISLLDSSFNILENNTINSNNNEGILTDMADYNEIVWNTISGNYDGVRLTQFSHFNLLANNSVSNNYIGIRIVSNSGSNDIYHNNLISNTIQENAGIGDDWYNDQQEGNYWSCYHGQDNGANGRISGDGIGDTNLPHRNIDNFPFTNQFGWLYPGDVILTDPGDFNEDGNYVLSWNQVIRAIGFILEEDVNITFDSPTTIYQGSNLSFEVLNRNNNTYFYRLKAYTCYEEGPWSNIVDITVDWPPSIPQNLQASVNPVGNTINLTWDLNSVDTKEYILHHRSELFDWSPEATLLHPIHSFNHTGLQDEIVHSYMIMAKDHRDQISGFSDIINATPCDSVAPAVPTNFSVKTTTHDSITLVWDDNIELDCEGYNIYRNRKGNPIDWGEPLNIEPIDNTIFEDSSLDELTTYYYVLTALDEVPNESDFSDVVMGKTLLGPHGPEINNSLNNFNLVEDIYDDTTINLYHWFKDVNHDDLTFRCSGQVHIEVTIYQENGTVTLIPELNWNGEETLTFYAKDKDVEISDKVTITVTPVNDPPDLPIITSPKDGNEFNDGSVINFVGECFDPDIAYGDILTYKWSSNISGDIGEGEVQNGIYLPIGMHLIAFEVSDVKGLTSIASINITILETPTSDSDGDGIPNIWERDNGLNPDDPKDALLDFDGDGVSNLDEYKAGTNPQMKESNGDGNGTTSDGDANGTDPTGGGDTPSNESSSSTTLLTIIIAVLVVALLATLWFLKKPPFAKPPFPAQPPPPGQPPAQPPLQAQLPAQPPPKRNLRRLHRLPLHLHN